MTRVRLSLGPLLGYWPRAAVEAFYDEAGASPIDIVYLGEVVCGKRHELALRDLIAIGKTLAAAGKEVVLSTLALCESESDLRLLRRLVDNGDFAIEANDMGAVHLAAQARVPFVIGPHINAYNPATLEVLLACGARRWVVPIELPRDSIRAVREALHSPLGTELFAYGRLSLALSARCFTARDHDRPKDDCGFACLEHADGLPVSTQDGTPLFVLNGVQTQSARRYSLAPILDQVIADGIDVLRISPQAHGTLDVVAGFREALDRGGAMPLPAALADANASNGYWRGGAGIETAG